MWCDFGPLWETKLARQKLRKDGSIHGQLSRHAPRGDVLRSLGSSDVSVDDHDASVAKDTE